MKRFTLLSLICLCLSGCWKHENPTAEADQVTETDSTAKVDLSVILKKRIDEVGNVSFKSWNGHLRGLDSDDVLHFHKDSKLVWEEMGLDVNHHTGTYELGQDGRLVVTLERHNKVWPPMILRRDGDDLLLFREDGVTSRYPEYPDDHNLIGFWPFRASLKNAQQ